MTIEQFREVLDAKPFRPFTIHLADGREIPVLDREYILAAPSGKTAVVCEPDDTLSFIDLGWVTELKTKTAGRGRRK